MEGPELDVIVVSGNVPAFIIKLWRLVEDPKFDDYISWSKSGTTFIVHSSTEFAREILPLFFKHNNFASFVRQLNMYGFRKVLIAEPTGMKPDRDDWEFHHPNFVRGKSELLELVKRKGQLDNEKKIKSSEVEKLFGDIRALETQNNTITSQMNVLKSENELLWRELTDVREKHERQQQIINKLLRFFVSMVYRKNTRGGKRRLAIEDGASSLSKRRNQGPELNSTSSGELPSLEYYVESVLSSASLCDTWDLFLELEKPTAVETPGPNISGNNASIILMDNDIVTLEDSDDPIVKDTEVPISPVSLENLQHEQWISKPDAPLKVKIPRRKGVPEKLSIISTPVGEEPDSSNSHLPTMVTGHRGRKEVVAPMTSCHDRQSFDCQLETITQGLETVQNRLQGDNLYIDPVELQELFTPSEMSNVDITSQFLGSDTDVMEELATSKSLAGSSEGSGEGTGQEVVEYSKPFSPGQFLNEFFGNTKESTIEEISSSSSN